MSIHLLSRGMLKAPSGGGGLSFVAGDQAYVGNDWQINVPTPAGVQDGDQLLCAVVTRDNTGFQTPAGWTLVDSQVSFGTTWETIYVFKKIASSEGASTTFQTIGAAYKPLSGIMLAFNGHGGIGNTNKNTGFAPTSLNTATVTATAGSLIVSFCAASNSITPPGTGTAGGNVTNGRPYLAAEIHGPEAGGTTTARTFSFSSGSACASITVEVLA